MKSFTAKAILVSLLLVLLHAQTGSNIYQVNGQSFQYIMGSGQEPSMDLGNRVQGHSDQFVPDSTYTPPPVAKVSTISCPSNQVYNNILCECVCILGFYMKNGHCHQFDPENPVCGRN